MKRHHNKQLRASLISAVVIAIAGYVLFAVMAAGPAVELEAEKSTGADIAVDTTASGGKAVQFKTADPGKGSAPTPPPGGPWKLVFNDEFDGDQVDTAKWTDKSGSQSDNGQGNSKTNGQLEWNQLANCSLGGGSLMLTAKREPFTSPSGTSYDWTSCLLTTSPSFEFKYAYIEERAQFPSQVGFWPAFWTWQAPGINQYIETDVYEFYSHERQKIHLSQHSGGTQSCDHALAFDPTTNWHVYAADITAAGTAFYIDGQEVCKVPNTTTGMTNLITNLAVFADTPPEPGTTTATKKVDYIRAWQKQ